SVAAQFHDTWLTENSTNLSGNVGFEYLIPASQALGQVTITLYYNGSSTLLSDASTINTVTVRSITVLVVDSITDNPIAGGSFNVTGTLVSDNGSAIITRDGTPMLPTLTFDIDGFDNTFLAANGTVQGDGTWRAQVTLSADFPRNTHTITAQYTPPVNFYEGSSGNNTFDSRGYSVLTITSPTDLNLNNRTVRGENITVFFSLYDNAGNPIEGETISINFSDLPAGTSPTTDLNGFANLTFTISNITTPGPHYINASYAGLAGSTGVIGDIDWTRVVVLAPTELTVTSVEGSRIAGQNLIVNGTLLDEHGNALRGTDGNESGGIVHLIVDGFDVGPTWAAYSNASTGEYSIIYTLPQDIDAGNHTLTVEFLGGYLWVDPVGAGDSVNPEYYLGSSLEATFNATQPTNIQVSSGGEVDREDLISVSGVLLDSVDRPVGDMTISIYLDGVFLTNVTSDSLGSFEVFYPVPADMTLGVVTMDVNYYGAEFYLPSSAQIDWEVYSSVVVEVAETDAAATGDTVVIMGTVRDNLPEGWIDGHSVDIRIDGMLIGNATTDANGSWAISWTIPQSTSQGEHIIEVVSPAQGWYRSGLGNGTIMVAHHTAISISSYNGGDATRGAYWILNGRLYDSDEAGLPGVGGATVQIALDGASFSTVTTDSNGNFTIDISVDMSSSRGDHTVTARYDGDTLLLSSERDTTVTTWSDVDVQVTFVSDNAIRGDTTHPIRIEGRVVELGGSGNALSNQSLSLISGNTTIDSNYVVWDNETGTFAIEFVADRYMSIGDLEFTLTSNVDSSRYLNSDDSTFSLFLRVRVVFDIGYGDVEWGGYSINGSITARDYYSSQAIPSLSVEAHLRNDSAIDPLDYQRAGDTNDYGVWTFEFDIPDSMDPYSDQDTWGPLHLWFNSTSPVLSDDSRAELARSMYVLEYEPESAESESISGWVWAVATLVLIGAGGGLWMFYMRRKETLDELAEIFSYTAELLAAGDEIREAIFHCYEEMCGVLMAQGLLRRDFETVREFEMAIRKAMPISEEALTALDNMFEIARYSRHELDDSHRQQAANALQRTLQEIQSTTQVPVAA
ncbi:MAG: hypothetical protein QF440_00525, partial [Candidatus Thalassarchaeaceae archaeon]|nr:hypothetical protein [Candidatus Thalassarchaeaceae archaeon]